MIRIFACCLFFCFGSLAFSQESSGDTGGGDPVVCADEEVSIYFDIDLESVRAEKSGAGRSLYFEIYVGSVNQVWSCTWFIKQNGKWVRRFGFNNQAAIPTGWPQHLIISNQLIPSGSTTHKVIVTAGPNGSVRDPILGEKVFTINVMEEFDYYLVNWDVDSTPFDENEF